MMTPSERTLLNRTRLALAASCLAWLSLLFLACPAQSPDNEGVTTKDSGNKVLLPVPDDPTVSFMVWFKVGSQNDPPGKEGLAQLTGSLISDGSTKNNSYDQILEKLYPLASAYGVNVDKEMTTIVGRTHVDNIDTFFELLSDAYLRPAFSEEDFGRTKSNQLNYLEKTLRYASDEDLGKAALTDFVFAGTSYQHPVSGTIEGLKAITVDDVRQFYSTWYTQANATVALGGGYGDALVGRFEATLAELPTSPATVPAAASVQPTAINGHQVTLVAKDDADASISFGAPISARRGERDFYALWLAISWLGEHRSSTSHLYQVIREARGMNYGDYAYIEAYPGGGRRDKPPSNVAREHQLFEVWIRTLPNEQAIFALRAALREVVDLVEGGMSEADFELTRSFLSKYYLHFAETTADRLAYAVDDHFYGIEGQGHLDRFGETIASLTLGEVNAALKKYLNPKNLKIVIVTGEAEKLKGILESDAATPMTYESDKSPDILAEDKEIESYPLAISAVRIVPVEEIFGK